MVGSWGEVYVLSMKVAVLTVWKRVVGLIVRGYIRLALKLREVRRSFVSVMMMVRRLLLLLLLLLKIVRILV